MKKKIFQKFSDRSEIFFCLTIHKKLNKSCSLEKFFLFLKKKVVSLKKTSFSFFSKVQWQIIFLFNVLALENILVALTREIGDGPCFLYIKFSWIGVSMDTWWSLFSFDDIPNHNRSSWADFIHGLIVHPQGCQGCQKIRKNILQIILLS